MKTEFIHGYNLPCRTMMPGDFNQTVYAGSITCPECLDILNLGWVIGIQDGVDVGLALLARTEQEYCDCGGEWRLRINKEKGVKFLGCSNFPKCKNTKAI